MKILKGDTVKILKGKDKGKTGKIEMVLIRDNAVRVEGINAFKKHFKARAQNQKSEIITIYKPVKVANVALICPKCKKPTRVGIKMEKDTRGGLGKKVRICRKCEKLI